MFLVKHQFEKPPVSHHSKQTASNIDKLQETLAKARARKRLVEAGVTNIREIGRDLVAVRRAK